jgi:hypothetical protein
MVKPILLYLDPGTGATLAQLALAGTAGIAAAVKLRMNKIKRRLNNEQSEDETEDAAETEETTSPQ